MNIREIQDEIIRLKKENDICILAHSYVSRDVREVADYTGDSYKLSVLAKEVKQKTVLMCGVRFMAETVKILSPEKRVLLSNGIAGCPMAEQMSKDFIESVKKENPGYTVVAYVNTTALLKTVCDVCVTSSSAVQIVKNIDNKNIIFIPDCNLGAYVAKMVPEKNIKLLQGGCPIHASIDPKEAEAMRAAHPNAKMLVHPECVPAISLMADYAGSTAGILDYARKSDADEFIIGTEISIAEQLQYEFPDKKFYPLSMKLICPDMKATTLMDVYNAVRGKGGEEIELDDDVIVKARGCIDEMIRLGG
ncbi:MAG: quinolinate synthase NadA [Ruminococcaceae bacterium]|nr:quinolinate synthase NadA [Oscillospiraceae bacterium]